MKSPIFTKSFRAAAAIRPNRIIQGGAADFDIIEATGASQVFLGVSDALVTAAIGDVADVHQLGTADVLLGGVVTRWQRVTSDANGAGVAAAPGAGVNASFVGIALQSGVAGDIIQILLTPGSVIQG